MNEIILGMVIYIVSDHYFLPNEDYFLIKQLATFESRELCEKQALKLLELKRKNVSYLCAKSFK